MLISVAIGQGPFTIPLPERHHQCGIVWGSSELHSRFILAWSLSDLKYGSLLQNTAATRIKSLINPQQWKVSDSELYKTPTKKECPLTAAKPEVRGTTGSTPTKAEGRSDTGAWTGPALSTWGSQMQMLQACYTAKRRIPRRLFKISEMLT